MKGSTPKPTSAKTQTSPSPTKNQSKPSSSKSKGEKGEKLTTKQKKLLEQKKKEEEEKQKKEEEERIRKEEEEERKRKEEEERKINEDRRKKAEEERKRLDEEKGSFESIISSLNEKFQSLIVLAKEEDEWNKFVNCENLPKLDDDVDMNNFISSWRDLNEIALKKEIRNINEDFSMVVEGCKVMNEIEYLLVEAISQSKKDLEDHCTKYLNLLSDCIIQTIDDATAHIMQYFDKYLSPDNDQYQKVHPFIKYGIWTNISKNLTRFVEYSQLNVIVELAVKGMGYQEIAIRAMYLKEDIFSSTSSHPQNLIVIGGVYTIDIVHIPPLVNTCEEWKIRQITELSTHVKRKPYTITNNDNQEVDGPPAKVVIPLPNIMLRSDKPTVAWWDEKDKIWTTDGIANTFYDLEAKTIGFLTSHLTCPLAVVYNKNLDKPFENWTLLPVPQFGRDAVVFRITPRFNSHDSGFKSISDITILINKDKCKLLSPLGDSLSEVTKEWVNPSKLLTNLSKIGINLIFKFEGLHSVKETDKSQLMEKHAYEGIAQVSLIVAISGSKWNFHPSVKRDFGLFRVLNSLIVDNSKVIQENDMGDINLAKIEEYIKNQNYNQESAWELMKYQKEKCGYISSTQPGENETVNLATVEKFQTHFNLILAMQERFQDIGLLNRVKESNSLTINSVKTLLNLIRPLNN